MAPKRNPYALLRTAACLASAVLMACLLSTPDAFAQTEICVNLKWFHQSQFAGFYVADQEGLYAAKGIKVRFVEGGPGTHWQEKIKSSPCPIGITNAYEILKARSDGVGVKAIAAIDQNSPIVWFALKERGIWNPRQFKGLKVAMVPTGRMHFLGMMQKVGLDPSVVIEKPFSLDMTPLYKGEVDVWSGYHTNLVTKAEAEGHKINIIHPMDYGVQIYDDVVYAREDFIKSSPGVLRGFVRATMQGWMKAIKDPMKAASYTLRYKSDADLTHDLALLLRTIPYVHTGQDPPGWMELGVWDEISRLAAQTGITPEPVDPYGAFTVEFLEPRKKAAGR